MQIPDVTLWENVYAIHYYYRHTLLEHLEPQVQTQDAITDIWKNAVISKRELNILKESQEPNFNTNDLWFPAIV